MPKASCYILVKICVIALLCTVSARAHEAGHGPPVSGQGPRGGKLSAVIKASDAEKGQEAPVVALVEYRIVKGREVVMKFWATDQKTDVKLSAPSKIKWIALPFDKSAKPAKITETPLGKPTTEVTGRISLIAPNGARAVEVILPGVLVGDDEAREKHVAFLHLEIKK